MNFSTFGNITEEMVITTLHEYLVKSGHATDDEGDFLDQHLYGQPENEIIGQILAAEVAIFIMRRTAYLCGSALDHMRQVRRDLIVKHKELTGYDMIDFNKDIDW